MAGRDRGIAGRLAAERERGFAGREAELELWSTALDREVPPFSVLYLHGPGGVGKSALIQQYADLAERAGRDVVVLDGRRVDSSPTGFREAVAEHVGAEPVQALEALKSTANLVLILDTYERLAPLDGWLRTALVPELSSRALVVLAGRTPLSSEWILDPSWSRLLRVVSLRNLEGAAARELLRARGVDPSMHEDVNALAHGHPLALVLLAEVLASAPDDRPVAELLDSPEVVEQLLARWVDRVPTAAHRKVLYAAAHAGVATEGLVRDVLGDADGAGLFDWLRDLPFSQIVPSGVALHDIVADALNTELRWRDPDGWAAMHNLVTMHLRARIVRAVGATQQLVALQDFLRLYRLNPLTRPFYDWSDEQTEWLEPATSADRDAIVAMTREHEGSRSAEQAAWWFEHQPESFWAMRSATSEVPAGFICNLRVDTEIATGSCPDDVVLAMWEHARQHGPVRSGECIRVVRFWIHREHHQGVATHHLVTARSVMDWMSTPGLAWAFVKLEDMDFFEPIFAFIDF
ncbi:MAG: ATP-binding protein, partial [Nitriliruptorales bacterium]|nr:ATP-binding protein [Nitriliruptorales bacterium]